MGLGGRALQPLGRLTKSTHAGSWSYRSSPPSRLASRHHDDTDPGFGLVARKCQLYRRLYMRTDPVQDGCHVTRQPGSDTVRTKDRLRHTNCFCVSKYRADFTWKPVIAREKKRDDIQEVQAFRSSEAQSCLGVRCRKLRD